MLLARSLLISVLAGAAGLSLQSCTDDQKKIAEAVKGGTDGHEFSVDKDGKVTFQADIVYFNFDDYTLTPDGMARLDALADYLKSKNGTKLKIEGHSDERGSTEYNLALGQLRSASVKNYLKAVGVTDKRLESVSFGEEKPALAGNNEGAWSKNRRAEFVFIGN